MTLYSTYHHANQFSALVSLCMRLKTLFSVLPLKKEHPSLCYYRLFRLDTTPQATHLNFSPCQQNLIEIFQNKAKNIVIRKCTLSSLHITASRRTGSHGRGTLTKQNCIRKPNLKIWKTIKNVFFYIFELFQIHFNFGWILVQEQFNL